MGVLTYFIVGGLVMYFYKGARGVEVIPNYTFWRGLPILIKVGGGGGEEIVDWRVILFDDLPIHCYIESAYTFQLKVHQYGI